MLRPRVTIFISAPFLTGIPRSATVGVGDAMKRTVAPESRASELIAWRGARATVWLFHATHKRLALMLSRRDEPEVLYVVAVGCEHIVGPFSWDLAEVVIAEHGTEDRVVDVRAGFELRCSSTTLVKGPATDFDISFEGFLGEDVADAP